MFPPICDVSRYTAGERRTLARQTPALAPSEITQAERIRILALPNEERMIELGSSPDHGGRQAPPRFRREKPQQRPRGRETLVTCSTLRERFFLNADASSFTGIGVCSGFDNRRTALALPFRSQASARKLC